MKMKKQSLECNDLKETQDLASFCRNKQFMLVWRSRKKKNEEKVLDERTDCMCKITEQSEKAMSIIWSENGTLLGFFSELINIF